MQARNVFVRDDRQTCAGPERGDARAERAHDVATDHDVIGPVAKADIDGGGFADAQRGGHHGEASATFRGGGTAAPSLRASSVTISWTIVSCGISRDITRVS